jgi:putative methionine-R-sulfoxide reductase with GAF domain
LFTPDQNLWSQALNGQIVSSEADIQNEHQHFTYAPLIVGGRPVAVFGLFLSNAETVALRDRLIVTDLLVGTVFGFLALLSTLILTRRFIGRPIAVLVAGTEQAAAGKLDIVMPGAANRDEIGTLAAAFNDMISRLRQTLESLDRRAAQIATSADVSRRLSTILSERQLIIEVVEQIKAAFDYYHVHIYLLDESTGDLIMTGGTGDVGASMLGSGHKIPKGKGLVGRAAETNAPVLVSDTLKDPDWLPNPLLPETASEAAVPIALADQVLGVLDVQHNKADGLKQEDLDLLRSLAIRSPSPCKMHAPTRKCSNVQSVKPALPPLVKRSSAQRPSKAPYR